VQAKTGSNQKADWLGFLFLPAGPIVTRFLPERLQIDCFILTAEGYFAAPMELRRLLAPTSTGHRNGALD